MTFESLDIILIIFGGFFFLVLRRIWYSDAFFGKSWKKYSTVGELSEKIKNRNYLTSFLLNLFTSAVILMSVKGSIEKSVNISFSPVAIVALFLFFTLPIVLTEYLFDSKNMKLFYIYYGYIMIAITSLSFLFSFLLQEV